MNLRRLVVLFSLLACLSGSAEPVTVPALGPRFKQTRERIDALFQNRTAPYAPLDPSVNVFRLPPPVVVTETPGEIKNEEPSDSDEAILQQALSTLKRNALMRGGRLYVSINQKFYQEGDTVSARVKDKTISLTLKRVTNNSVTFTYGDAELTVPF